MTDENNLHYLIDGQLFDCKSFGLDSKAENFLFQKRILSAGAKGVSLNFVGAFQVAQRVFVVFPKTSLINENEDLMRVNAQLLLKSLIKFSNENTIAEENDNAFSVSKEKEVFDKLKTVLYILDDYRKNGIVNFSESIISVRSSGKINWSKTIKKSTPIFNNNMEPIYTSLLAKKNIVKNNDLLTSLHKYFVNYSNSLMGWYYTKNEKLVISHEIDFVHNLPCSISTAIFTVKRALNEEFSGRKINLYKKFLIMLENHDQATLGQVLGVSDYWRVWEHMAKKVFNDVYASKYSNDIPQPRYFFTGDHKSKESIGQRFDLVSEKGETLYLIDAKYYDVLKTRPGWKDIVKQFFYEKSLRLIVNKEVVNILIFPDPGKEILEKPIRIEMQSNQNKVSKEIVKKEFPTIYCQYFNIWEMIDCYNSNIVDSQTFEEMNSTFDLVI